MKGEHKRQVLGWRGCNVFYTLDLHPLFCPHKGSKDDRDFCKTLSNKEPYYGFNGTLKCLRDGEGDVGFFHSHDIKVNYQTLSTEFDIVCMKKKLPLKWDNVVKPDCHFAEEHSQVCFSVLAFVR